MKTLAVHCCSAALFFFGIIAAVSAAPDNLIQAANKTATEYRENLERLARWASENGLQDEAAQTSALVPPESSGKIYIPSFPLKIGTLDLPRGLPTTLPRKYAEIFRTVSSDEKPETGEESKGRELTPREVWLIQFRAIRQDYAKRLTTMARGSARNDRGALAVQLAVAGLQADPDHSVFRNVFGFLKHRDEWRTAWETDRLKKGFVDHERFGWIPQKALDRYEKGERFCEGKWVSVADDVRFHRQSIENGWKIQSEHYDIVTNHSHEEGVRLIRMLEDCYRAWKLLFLRYMATDPQLASLFDGRPVTTPQRRHRIYFYRNKDDFVLNLKTSSKDNTELYAGFYRYRENEGACHFYAVEEDEPEWRRRHVVRTMYHEATHQLFFETRKCSMSYGSRHNYWLVEGVAEYMESLQHEPNGYYVLGGEKKTIAWKMKNKENRLSTEQLCRINYKEFKGHLVKGESLYGQSHAMFDFLFHSEDGRWRDAVIVYLRAVYDGKDTPETLRTLTGCTFNELDAALERYLEQ